MPRRPRNARPTRVTKTLLGKWRLPALDPRGDKSARGRILIVAGSEEMPGAAILCAIAALRAGAGHLAIATASSVAAMVAAAVPEARVVGLTNGKALRVLAQRRDAVVMGPGMVAADELVRALLSTEEDYALVLDADAMTSAREADVRKWRGPLVLTPHSGEMATLLGWEKAVVTRDPVAACVTAAERYHATVALKGDTTYIANARKQLWASTSGNIGLATSGSGDVLAGIVGGLLARGASAEQAAVLANHVHGLVGDTLARRIAPVGFLARELLDEIAPVLSSL